MIILGRGIRNSNFDNENIYVFINLILLKQFNETLLHTR